MFMFGLTTAGRAALDANPGVPPVLNLARFGDAIGYTPDLADVDIHGDAVWQVSPALGQVLNSNTIIYSILLDDTQGPFNYGELGLFLPGNVLFALGSMPELKTKFATTAVSHGNTIRIDCFISTVGNTHNIYVAVADDADDLKLSSVGSIDALPPAFGVEPNVYIAPHPAHPEQSVIATALNGKWTVESYNLPGGSGKVTMVSPTAFNVSYTTAPIGNPPIIMYPGSLLMQFTAGPATGCIRAVSAVSPNHIEVTNPFFTSPNVNDPFLLYAINGTVAPVVVPPAPDPDPDPEPAEANPGGSNTQLQYNDSNSFGGIAKATYTKSTDALRLQAYTEGCCDLGYINTSQVPVEIDVNGYAAYRCILGGNVQFTLTNVKRNSPLPTVDTIVSMVLFVQQDATGGRELSFTGNTILWESGSLPSPSKLPNSVAIYVLTCFNGGSPDEFWIGSLVIRGAKVVV